MEGKGREWKGRTAEMRMGFMVVPPVGDVTA